MLRKVYCLLVLILFVLQVNAQDRKKQWVDSVFRRMSLADKIGQLFMVPASSYWKSDKSQALEKLVATYHVGGLFITHAGPVSQVKMINRLQNLVPVPLMNGIDAEWGLAKSVDSTMSFPLPLSLGAVHHDSLIYQLGKTLALQMKILGLQINFAPKTDLYQKGLPGEYLFGDYDEGVAVKSGALINGMQDQGVMAVAQHADMYGKIPGDTSTFIPDNHLDSTLFPVHRKLIRQGLRGIVTSQYSFLVLEKKKNVPAATSAIFIHDVLRQQLGFQGLTFANVSELQTISGRKGKGDAELLAFLAGNDVLIDPQNLGAATKKLTQAIRKDKELLKQLDQSVNKILAAKFEMGLADGRYVPADNLHRRLHAPEDLLLQHQLAEASVTVIRNKDQMIPIRSLENKRILSIALGESNEEFDHYLSQYAPIEKLSAKIPTDTVVMSSRIADAEIIIVQTFRGSLALNTTALTLLNRWKDKKQIIVCQIGDPDGLKRSENFPVLIQVYQPDNLLPKVAAQIIFGGMGSKGVLPVTVSNSMKVGSGIITQPLDRFAYTVPEAAELDSRVLERIQQIAQEAIDIKATPGCRVLVACHGKVIYDKSFGYLTYENKIPVTEETIYDLASVTKVSATLQTVMFLQERGLIDINKKISLYLPEFKGSNKENFIIKDILTHQAGLWPFLPFWAQTMKDTVYLPEYYSRSGGANFSLPVSKGLYASDAMKDSLWHWIIRARIIDKPGRAPYEYRYSDMGFYIMQHLAEKILNQPMEEFLIQNLYEPMGAYTTGYLPLRKFREDRIAPTEDDKLFRRSLLTGYVHDQGAAMQGGIAGHAGLFSTANDLAKLGQMWLQEGRYGGHQYFKKETLELFTEKQYETSRRGLGWDKPVAGDPEGPTSLYASQRTFGHTGFTGTCIWVDPEYDLVYVFLSNRVHPNMNNTKILNANIRPRIQEVIYRSLFSYCRNHP